MTVGTDAPTNATPHLTYKRLVSAVLWDRLVGRTMLDLEFQQRFGREAVAAQRRWAERILNQTIAFLYLLAGDRGGNHSPSPLVDIGWHVFLMYTREYAEFCNRVLGRFIHHSPNDVPGVAYATNSVELTVKAMCELHLQVDAEVWVEDARWCGEWPPKPPQPKPGAGKCAST